MSDDQDTTAPGRVGITIKRVEVDTGADRDWVYDVLAGWWAIRLSANIEAAAWEEMRVRHSVVRALQLPFCFHCGGLLARPCGCETPGCRPGMAQTSICNSCNSPVPDGLYPCPACDYRPWDGAVVLTSGGRRQ